MRFAACIFFFEDLDLEYDDYIIMINNNWEVNNLNDITAKQDSDSELE